MVREEHDADVSEAMLMERAVAGLVSMMQEFFPRPGTLVCYCGKGNNAGDALGVAVALKQAGWTVFTRMSAAPSEMTPLAAGYYKALDVPDWKGQHPTGPLVFLDGLVGIGARGLLRPPLANLATEMNQKRASDHAVTVAIDLPSGICLESGRPSEVIVQADITAVIQGVPQALLADEATAYVGRLVVIPVEGLRRIGCSGDEVITPAILKSLLPPRAFSMHKGQAGRVVIVAGSERYAGAASLASLGALHGGAGLVTLCCETPREVPLEVMTVKTASEWPTVLATADAVVLGPGLGHPYDAQLMQWIKEQPMPTVIDADALNALSRHGVDVLTQAKGPRLLTPHPGEMQRLAGPCTTRMEWALDWSNRFPTHTLLLKGARTVIATHGQPLRYNSTGHPGMASGGMGDVLSGLLGALLAQGLKPHDAAALGSWLLGRAGEVIIQTSHQSAESLTASQVANALGKAWNLLRETPL
jgi:ADP-dependent NAD(P)H-hydrate dehydratase / NAD(P)H-hydrate epimerase